MSKLDGTGPMGQGAGSGRGMGSCGSGVVRRSCCGRLAGSGVGRRFSSAKNDLPTLQKKEQFLNDELADIQERIKDAKDKK